MENKEELQLTLEGLNCANCARKIEEKVGKMEGVKESNLNFTTTTLNVKLERKVKEEHAINEIKKIADGDECCSYISFSRNFGKGLWKNKCTKGKI